jgi:tetratricopeptide (TPR) repeat protein
MRFVFVLVVAAWLPLFVQPVLADGKKDTADCKQFNDHELQIAGCTRIIKTAGLPVPFKAIAHNNLANAMLRNGDLDSALLECAEAIRLDPKQVRGYLCRAGGLLQKGEFDLAIAAYDLAVKVNPNSGSALAGRARAHFEKGDVDRAISDVNEGIRIEPNAPDAYAIRSRIEMKIDGLDAAIADINETIRLKPDLAQAYAMRGSYWQQKGNLDRALADQDKAIQLEPQSPLNRVARSITERYRGDLKAALADSDEALKLRPDYIAAFTVRGQIFEKTGDLVRARQEFQRAIDSKSVQRSGLNVSFLETARAQLAALDSGAPQPVIAIVPSRTGSSIPTPALVAPTAVGPARSQDRRVALVIGNSAYRNAPALINPQHDAEVLAQSLRALGFSSVTLVQDATRETMIEALRKFGEEAEKADWAMIYYAGHGIEVNGINYLIPIDARLSTDRDVQYEAVPMDQAMASIEGARKLKLILLDACRDNPFAPQMRRTAAAAPAIVQPTTGATIGTRSMARGLGEVKVTGATLVVYAAKQGETALDGAGGNSPFVVAVVQRVTTPNLEINKLFRLIRDDVMEATGGRQEPYTYGSLPGREEFYFLKTSIN